MNLSLDILLNIIFKTIKGMDSQLLNSYTCCKNVIAQCKRSIVTLLCAFFHPVVQTLFCLFVCLFLLYFIHTNLLCPLRCKTGFRLSGDSCVSSCTPNPCFNNVSCSLVNSRVMCRCPPGWRGQFCDTLAPELVKSGNISDSAMAAMIISIISALSELVSEIHLIKTCIATNNFCF